MADWPALGQKPWSAALKDYIDESIVEGDGSLTGTTIDTGAPVRLIMFSNQAVKAIPFDTPDPTAPTGLTATPSISHVSLAWTAPTTPAASYQILRDGVVIGTSTAHSYRDNAVASGATYSYTVKTVDAYSQASPASSAATAFIDPALNQAPVVLVKAWPPAHFTDGKTLIRVAATDADAQDLALSLSVDSGSLTATDDPSIWYYQP